jgi:Protein of unknown function (DUF2442)
MNPTVAAAEFVGDRLEITLRDQRRASASLSLFPRFAAATPEARGVWEPCATGLGIHWPLTDEDLSVAGLLRSDRGAA